jgi:membrane protein DedA with SNARE-associated domain
MALLPFTIASAVGRGARFYLVAALMAWGGERMEGTLRRYVDRIGWLMLLLIVVVILAQGIRG